MYFDNINIQDNRIFLKDNQKPRLDKEIYGTGFLINLNKMCRKYDIHTVCLHCKRECKQKYSYWSGQMPPNIYCTKFLDCECSINANLIGLRRKIETIKEYPLLATGISNRCYFDNIHTQANQHSLGVQFYEVDKKTNIESIENQIIKFFNNDCLRLETSKGFHYVSFLIKNLYSTLTIANHLTFDLIKNFEISDYYKSPYDCLILRITPKRHWFSRKIKTEKPKFDKLIKPPIDNLYFRYSLKHLLYFKKLGIPNEIIDLYPKRQLRNFNIAKTEYHTSNQPYIKRF